MHYRRDRRCRWERARPHPTVVWSVVPDDTEGFPSDTTLATWVNTWPAHGLVRSSRVRFFGIFLMTFHLQCSGWLQYVMIMDHALSSPRTSPRVGVTKCLNTHRNATNNDNLNSSVGIVTIVLYVRMCSKFFFIFPLASFIHCSVSESERRWYTTRLLWGF